MSDVSAITYPKRPSHFAHRFVRLLFRTCAAAEIGPDAALLLVAVAHTEDAKRYTGPVRFFAQNLADQCGFSVSSMERAREKAVKAGWLHYEPGAKSRMATYWVKVPAHLEDIPDGPNDHGDDDILRQIDGASGEKTGSSVKLTEQVGSIRGASDGVSGEHLTDLHTYPCPLPNTHTPASPAQGVSEPKPAKKTKPKTDHEADPRFVQFWQAYPLKVGKPDAAKAFAKVNPSPELLTVMLAAIEAQKGSRKWVDGYIRNPSTWLNNRGWEDQLPPANGPATSPAQSRHTTKTITSADLDQDLYGPPAGGGR